MKHLQTYLTPSLLIICLIGFFHIPSLEAQSSIDQLRDKLSGIHGKEKLLVLNDLTKLYLETGKERQALKYAKRAVELAENIIRKTNSFIKPEEYYLKPLAYLQLGKAHQKRGRYTESKAAYRKASESAEELEVEDMANQAKVSMLEMDSMSKHHESKKKGLGGVFEDIASTTRKTTSNIGINGILKLAKIQEQNGNYRRAIFNYREAINKLKDKGDYQRIIKLREHIAELLIKNGKTDEAIQILTRLKKERERVNDKSEAVRYQEMITEIGGGTLPSTSNTTQTPKSRPHSRPRSIVKSTAPSPSRLPDLSMPPKLIDKGKEIAKAEDEVTEMKRIAEDAEDAEDFEESLYYYKKYVQMEQETAEKRRLQEIELLEQANQITLLKEQEETNKTELKRQVLVKQSMGGGLLLSLGILSMLYLLYRNKKQEHQKLGVAYQDLEVAQNNLQSAEQRIKTLLHQQVSKAVANELLATDGVQKVERRFVCIMFLDIRNFTPFVEKLSPEEIINYQNNVFGFMMEKITERKGIVNQIMGDGFMATFGAPVSAGNDCMEAYLAAREIMEMVSQKSESGEIPPTKVGIGLHAGYVVTGNVGTKTRKQFSVTGNAVITAARLEQLNKKYGSTLVISKDVYDQLPQEVQTPLEFNEVTVKGRSEPVEVAAFF